MHKGFLACGLIAVFTFAVILVLLVRYPMMYGIDGPYYIVQVRHLLRDGALKYPDPPLSFYMLAPFYLLFSDPNLGLKVGVAFYVAFTSIIFYLAVRGGSDGWAASAAALLFVVSPYTLRLSMDFIKNTVGLLFVALFLFSVYVVKGRGKAALIGGLSAVGAAATHVLDFGVLALMAVLILLYWIIFRRGSEEMVYSSASVTIVSALILGLSLFVLPQLLGYDAEKLLAFLGNPVGGGKDSLRKVGALEQYIPVFVVALAGLIYSLWLGRRRRLAPAIFAASVLLMAMNLPALSSSWLFRFRLMNSITIPLIASAAVIEAERKTTKTLTLLLLLGFAAALTVPMIPAMRPSIPPQGYEELEEVSKIIPQGSTLVVPNTALRYWVEALLEDRYVILEKPPKPMTPNTYLILEAIRRAPKLPVKPIFDGEFIKVYPFPKK